jgi:hypothetical protein
MRCFLSFTCLLLCLIVTARVAAQDKPASPFEKWEKDMAAFEAQDAKSPPAKGGIVFVGSSSIRLWNVKESFPDLDIINRGFGGSQTIDSVHFAPRIVRRQIRNDKSQWLARIVDGRWRDDWRG